MAKQKISDETAAAAKAQAALAAGSPGQQRPFNVQVLFAMLGAKDYDLNEARGDIARLQGQLRQAQARIAELEIPSEEEPEAETPAAEAPTEEEREQPAGEGQEQG